MDITQTIDNDRIMKIDIEEEMKSSYINYSMSVIVARALPDVRDGFKPVHRRILYGMMGINNTSTQPYKKCARIVGEVLGKYHPHGDSSVYGALVRLAQDWNMRYTLVDAEMACDCRWCRAVKVRCRAPQARCNLSAWECECKGTIAAIFSLC